MRRRALLLVLLVWSLMTPAIMANAPRVRPVSARMSDLVHEAAMRSPTVAALLRAIEASDVILHVDYVLDDDIQTGSTYLAAAAGAARYVRTVISIRLPPDRRIELLAHELQHVVEIAGDRAVRDQDAMREKCQALGWRDLRPASYETWAAIEVERKVRDELRRR